MLKDIRNLEELVRERTQKGEVKINLNRWTKYNKDRLYIEIRLVNQNKTLKYYIDLEDNSVTGKNGQYTQRSMEDVKMTIGRTIVEFKEEIKALAGIKTEVITEEIIEESETKKEVIESLEEIERVATEETNFKREETRVKNIEKIRRFKEEVMSMNNKDLEEKFSTFKIENNKSKFDGYRVLIKDMGVCTLRVLTTIDEKNR